MDGDQEKQSVLSDIFHPDLKMGAYTHLHVEGGKRASTAPTGGNSGFNFKTATGAKGWGLTLTGLGLGDASDRAQRDEEVYTTSAFETKSHGGKIARLEASIGGISSGGGGHGGIRPDRAPLSSTRVALVDGIAGSAPQTPPGLGAATDTESIANSTVGAGGGEEEEEDVQRQPKLCGQYHGELSLAPAASAAAAGTPPLSLSWRRFASLYRLLQPICQHSDSTGINSRHCSHADQAHP